MSKDYGYTITAVWGDDEQQCERWYERFADAKAWASKLFASPRRPADLAIYVRAIELGKEYELDDKLTLYEL